MKFAIIADDLTGANDSGVQLAQYGLHTSVLFQMNAGELHSCDAVVWNTDSRSCSPDEAYARAKSASEFVRTVEPEVIYKKIDSTLRGNMGREIDAMFDTFQPDFVIVAPAYPSNGRRIVNGYHYLHDRPLHETEVASDPKTPVTESFVPKLLQTQTQRSVGLVTCDELRSGAGAIAARLDSFRQAGVPYIVFDADREADIEVMVEAVTRTKHRVVWVGSAGLVQSLASHALLDPKEKRLSVAEASSIIVVVGSVSGRSRGQLEELLGRSDVEGVALRSDRIVADGETRREEMDRVCQRAAQLLGVHKHLALYSTASEEDRLLTKQAGAALGLDATAISDLISAALGETVVRLLEQFESSGLVLTGGDTAVQVCRQLGAERLDLIGEVEPGVPVGRLMGMGAKELFVVTKAGSFGTDKVLLKSVDMLKGESYS